MAADLELSTSTIIFQSKYRNLAINFREDCDFSLSFLYMKDTIQGNIIGKDECVLRNGLFCDFASLEIYGVRGPDFEMYRKSSRY